ncbi:hypothetical protein GN956_G15111 [Arapaima gigas]
MMCFQPHPNGCQGRTPVPAVEQLLVDQPLIHHQHLVVSKLILLISQTAPPNENELIGAIYQNASLKKGR